MHQAVVVPVRTTGGVHLPLIAINAHRRIGQLQPDPMALEESRLDQGQVVAQSCR